MFFDDFAVFRVCCIISERLVHSPVILVLIFPRANEDSVPETPAQFILDVFQTSSILLGHDLGNVARLEVAIADCDKCPDCSENVVFSRTSCFRRRNADGSQHARKYVVGEGIRLVGDPN